MNWMKKYLNPGNIWNVPLNPYLYHVNITKIKNIETKYWYWKNIAQHSATEYPTILNKNNWYFYCTVITLGCSGPLGAARGCQIVRERFSVAVTTHINCGGLWSGAGAVSQWWHYLETLSLVLLKVLSPNWWSCGQTYLGNIDFSRHCQSH